MFHESEDKKKYSLNNCPFCGSAHLKISRASSISLNSLDGSTKKQISEVRELLKAHQARSAFQADTDQLIFYSVCCRKCGANGPSDFNPESAASYWNKATPQPSPFDKVIKGRRSGKSYEKKDIEE